MSEIKNQIFCKTQKIELTKFVKYIKINSNQIIALKMKESR